MKSLLIGLAVVLMSVGVLIALPFKNKTTLSWDAVTTNEDGTPADDLAGYKAYWGAVSGNYTGVQDVGNVTTVQINSLGSFKGNVCFSVTAYDVVGNESDYSNEVCANMVIKKKAPTNVVVQ